MLIFPELIAFDDYPFLGMIEKLESYCLSANLTCINLLPELSQYSAHELWAHETDRV